jgi:hypothetical protein
MCQAAAPAGTTKEHLAAGRCVAGNLPITFPGTHKQDASAIVTVCKVVCGKERERSGKVSKEAEEEGGSRLMGTRSLSADSTTGEIALDPTPVEVDVDPTPVEVDRDPTPAEVDVDPTPVEVDRDPTPAEVDVDPTPAEVDVDPTPAEETGAEAIVVVVCGGGSGGGSS